MRVSKISATATIALVFANAAYAGGSVVLRLGQDSVRVGLDEPVIANITIYNDGDAPSRLDLGTDFKAAYSLAVTFPDGHYDEFPPRAIEGMGENGQLVVEAGKGYTRPFLLSEWIAFDVIGTYAIHIGLEGAVNTLSFKVIVGARDPENLAAVCSSLGKQVSGSDVGKSIWPALVLSFIPDPEAVPYLAKVADAGLEAIAIGGLARVGNRDAAMLIKSIMQRFHDEVLILVARNALRRIRDTTTDQALKEEIKLILFERRDLDEKYQMQQ